MKKILYLVLLFPCSLFAQNFHFSVKAGAAGYQGDLKAKTVSLSQAAFIGSIGARYDLSEHFSLRSYLSLTSLRGDDKKGTVSMQTRNLNFKTKLFEWEAGVQYSLFDLNNVWWTPYVSAGIGLFHFNPYTTDPNGDKVFLRALSTEGQGFITGKKNYSLTQFNLPLAIGAERMLDEDTRVGVELGYRKLFTDYLDDVSTVYVDQNALLNARGQQAVDLAYRYDEIHGDPYPQAGITRGNPRYKDGYFFVQVTFTRRFYFDKYKEIAGIPSARKGKKVGCPATRY